MMRNKSKHSQNRYNFNLAQRYCTVHNATDGDLWGNGRISPSWGAAKLYYNPEERYPEGIQSFDQCKEWCRSKDHCELARWYDQAKECHVYRFPSMERNRDEVLHWCYSFPLYVPYNPQYGTPQHVYSANHCPHNATHQISCSSYPSKYESCCYIYLIQDIE